MAKGKNQKVKLIKILEILRKKSDESHPMATNTLAKKLKEEGVDVERKTLYDDIACLNECGYEIMTIKTNANHYYIEDRTFSVAEIKILLDAINAAKFVTDKKTSELTTKIASLAGEHKGEVLKRNALSFGNAKHTNEKIYYNVDTINQAIEDKKKLKFKYFHYDIGGERVYSKEGEVYEVIPVALCYADDNYYLITFSEKYNDLAHYRVDRMDVVEESENTFDNIKEKRKDIEEYNRRVFSMFGGKEVSVTMKCDNSIIDAIVDKFGEKTMMSKYDENSFTFSAVVAVSPTFFSWCFTFGDKIQIVSPKEVVNEMKEKVDKIKLLY